MPVLLAYLLCCPFLEFTPPLPPSRAAALLACTCRGFRAAYADSWWPSLDPATGNVLEPRSGRFWRELSPGDDVRAAVDACPEGGCILLRPGTHTIPVVEQERGGEQPPARLGLLILRPLNIFGRGLATLQAPGCDVIVSLKAPACPVRDIASLNCEPPPPQFSTFSTLDGLVFRAIAGSGQRGVLLSDSNSRLQACVIHGGGLQIDSSLFEVPSPDHDVVINCRWAGGNVIRLRNRLLERPARENYGFLRGRGCDAATEMRATTPISNHPSFLKTLPRYPRGTPR